MSFHFRSTNNYTKVVTISASILQPLAAFQNLTQSHGNAAITDIVKQTFDDYSDLIQQSAPDDYITYVEEPDVEFNEVDYGKLLYSTAFG